MALEVLVEPGPQSCSNIMAFLTEMTFLLLGGTDGDYRLEVQVGRVPVNLLRRRYIYQHFFCVTNITKPGMSNLPFHSGSYTVTVGQS